MLLSPATEPEIEVAGILNQLSDLVCDLECRRFGDLPRWGIRRRRSLPPEEPAPRQKEETSSPATPMSFPASCSDDADVRRTVSSGGGASSPRKQPPLRNAKRHKEWVKEAKERIAILLVHKVNLGRELAEARDRHRSLMAESSRLKELTWQLRVLTGEWEERRNLQRMQTHQRNHQANGSVLASVCSNRGPQQQREASWDAAAAERSPRREFDLNESPEEIERRQRAAASAQARKRRIEIQREKIAAATAACSPAPSSLMSFKMPRYK